MESFRKLYQIIVRHDYFEDGLCPSLNLMPSMESRTMMTRRNILFRQMDIGCWSLFSMAEPDTDNDVLYMELYVSDPAFVIYTDWPDFKPSGRYELQLPTAADLHDAASAIRLTDRKRSIGEGFCSVGLHLNRKMTDAAFAGNPEEVVLQFHAPEKQWEYLFIPQSDETIDGSMLLLEDAKGNIRFGPFTPCMAYGRTAWRTVSEKTIRMRDSYDCRLRLMALSSNGKQKRILLSQIKPPQPGQFMDNQNDMLRQVCYF